MSKSASFSIDPAGHVRLSGELTLDTVTAIYQRSRATGSKETAIQDLDLADVSRVDSSGLALLLEWQSLAHKRGHTIRIRNAPEGLLSLTRLCEASGLMEFEGRSVENLQNAGSVEGLQDTRK